MDFNLQNLLFDPFPGKIVSAVIGVLIVIIIVRLLQRMVGSRIQNQSARYGLHKSLGFASYFVITLVLISIFSDQLGNLTVAFGVAGAGIAFALQEVIASIAGWIAVSFGGFYKVGDRVQLGGIKGDVIDIGILRTSIMEIGEWVKGDQYSGRIVRIANSFVFKEPVFNYSGDFPFLWDELTIPIKYGSDYPLARQLILDAAQEIVGEYATTAKEYWKQMVKKYIVEDAFTDPMISIVANDNWVEFTLRYVVDYKKRRGTKDRIFFLLLAAIEKTEGKVSFASTTIHLVETPPLKVQIQTN
jgi:small-conductance mechanosensitive channel